MMRIADTLRKSWEWNERLLKGETIEDILVGERVGKNYIYKVLNLRFLSPKIQKMILMGLKLDKLDIHKLRENKISNWKKQEEFFEV